MSEVIIEVKQFSRISWHEIRRTCLSCRFWGSVCAMVLLLILDALPSLCQEYASQASFLYTDIITLTGNFMGGASYMFWIRFCVFSIPYACSFYDEYAAGAAKYRLQRGGSLVYGGSKILAGIVTVAGMVFLSQVLFALILTAAGVPLLSQQEEGNQINQILLYRMVADGNYAGFYLLMSAFSCFAGIYFATMTMMLSAFIRNKYILLALPLALFYNLDSFSGLLWPNGGQPELTNWRVLFFSLRTNSTPMTEKAAFLRTAVYTLVMVAIFSAIFLGRVRKVVEHE